MMNNLQLLGTMLRFNLNVPPNTYIFFQYLEEFLSMKAKFIEDNLEKFNQLFISETISSSSGQGDKDYNSNVIKNIGTIILTLVGLIIAMVLVALSKRCSHNSTIIKISEVLKQRLFYNSILRVCFQSYLKFCIIAFASIYSSKDNVVLGTGLFFLNFTIFFFLFAHSFLRINRSNLINPAFSLKFNSLYMNLDVSNPHAYLMTTFFLARRFFLGYILSYSEKNPCAQFLYMNLTSLLMLMYLVKVRPMVSNYLNFIEIFNELILYGCTVLTAAMTDYQPETDVDVAQADLKEAE
jgi:hypothetical protein